MKVGDKIQLVKRVLSESKDDEYYIKQDGVITDAEIQAANERILDSILYEEIIEVEVIGVVEVDEQTKNKNESLILWGYDTYSFIPLNLYNDFYQNYYDAIQKFEKSGMIHEGTVNSYGRMVQYTYFELENADYTDSFTNGLHQILENHHIDSNINVNNDMYLKLAGPLASINSTSQFIVVISMGVSFIVLSCMSIIYVKERKNEIGILISLGDSKKKIILQLIAEMALVCSLGIGGSLITSRSLSKSVSDSILENYHSEEVEQDEQIITGFDQIELISEYKTSLETRGMIDVAAVTMLVMMISASTSILVVLRMKPKEICL